MVAAAVADLRLQVLAVGELRGEVVSYARGVLVSKSLTLPKGVHDGFLPVNAKKNNELQHSKKKENKLNSARDMSLRIVMQYVDSAQLLIDNVEQTVTIGSGVVVYVAFLGDVTEVAIDKAASVIAGVKIFSPAAGDRRAQSPQAPCSIAESDYDVLIVPQATLAGKVKGRLTQYHQQTAKEKAEQLYSVFCLRVRQAVHGPTWAIDVDQNGQNHSKQEGSGCRVLNGTFGNRQALQLSSSAPSTHFFEFE
jgi:D-Tyr-tRNAtyr deacylase